MLDEQREQRRAAKVAARRRRGAAKETLVAEAEKLATSDDWRGGRRPDAVELMDAWKALPRIDRAIDDALWRRFSSARTAYTRRRKAALRRAVTSSATGPAR